MIRRLINLIQNKIKFGTNKKKCKGCGCGGCKNKDEQIRNKYGFPTYQGDK